MSQSSHHGEPRPGWVTNETDEARLIAEEAAKHRVSEEKDEQHTAAEHGLDESTMDRLDHSG